MTREIVCNRVAEGLWQAGRHHWPDEVPDVDVALQLTPQGVPFAGPTIVISFPDSAEGVDPVIFDALRWLCYGVSERRVLTVCDEGKNRSGLASALILTGRGWSVEDAIERVQATASSPGTVGALSNPAFLRQLREME